MGTMPYMSPEQVEGQQVDHRTDIFSLGILMYEMATGARPFGGASSPGLMSSILKDEPAPVVDKRRDLPNHLGRIIGRCLEKDPRDRYQTARDVFTELKIIRRESGSISADPLVLRDAPEPASPSSAPAASAATRRDEGFWVAVLPFKYTGSDADIAALAEGLSGDIVTGLSRFSYLRVISRNSTSRFGGEGTDVPIAGEELGARYVMEGTLRRAGQTLRVAVQLVDTDSGAHLWAETYDRSFSSEAMFELQDDLVPRIVSTVADMNGVLPRSMSDALRSRDPDQLSPYEAVLRSFGYLERATPEELAAALSGLEKAARNAPDNADVWAMLAYLQIQDHAQGFRHQNDSLSTGLTAAHRAVEAGPSNPLAYLSLAQALFHHKEYQSFRIAAERAAALNPMDGNSMAFLGEMLTYAGDRERGLELAGRAKQLNPNHPGWYWYVDFYDAYRRGEYRDALGFALKVNLPGHWGSHAMLAAAYGQLEEPDAAKKAVGDLLRVRPDFAATARTDIEKWWETEYRERLIDGWCKAGLEIADDEDQAEPSPTHHASGEQRADEGFWVAVLPFKYAGSDADITALAEGLSGDIVTGLSRFSYLRVISRGSTLRYASEGADIRSVGEELGARYVMEGTLRQAGQKLRIAVQLVDATTGAHLWAENYERTFDAETIFEVQDDLVPRIVSTVADWYGALPRSMSEAVRQKPADQLSPYEAVLRSFGYFERIGPEEHAIVRAGLERAVGQSPGDADGWAMLSMMYGEEHRFGFNVQPDPLGRSLQAARRAVDAAPANNIAWLALAQALFFRKEFDAFHDAAERAIALNSMDGSTLEYVGHLIAFSGGWERGCDVSERARHLNPNHPGWYWVVHFLDAYRKDDYHVARDYALKAHHRGGGAQLFLQTLLAALYGQLGEREAAEQTLHKVLSQIPDLALTVRREFGKWYLPDLVEQLMDGLEKAGLDLSSPAVFEPTSPEAGDSKSPVSASDRKADGFWVAVLPFRYTGKDDDLEALAEGLSEEIVTGLSRFSYLRVISRSSTSRFADSAVDVRTVGEELSARYVMEGSLRQAGTKLRLAVQLVDTTTGGHLWAETYDRDFSPEELFDLQDDLVPRIVSTCADHFGVLARAISEAVRGKPITEITPYEALMRGFGYHFRLTAEEHTQARDALERAVERAPSNADCWAMLAWVYSHEYSQDFNPRPNSLDRALEAARRATDIAPSNHFAQQVLAVVLFFRKETAECRSAAERSMALNPLDGSNEAFFLITFLGEWERGCALIRHAMELNPHHPGWYRAPLGVNEYRKENYRAAIDEAVKANVANLVWFQLILAAAHGQLSETEAARKALHNLLALKEDFAESGRRLMGKWFEPELVEHLMDGLRKAGLEEAPGEAPGAPEVKSEPATSAIHAADGRPGIAVLPFINRSDDADNEYFSDGLTEELIVDLAGIKALSVISLTSAMLFKGTNKDLPTIGRELGVRYVLEGSVRKAGSSLRITAQLVDAETDTPLWSEKYSGTVDDVFEVQERVSREIVRELDVTLTSDENQRLAERPIADVRAFELFLQARQEIRRFEASAIERATRLLSQAIEIEGETPPLLFLQAMAKVARVKAGGSPDLRQLDEAEAQALALLERTPDLPQAHALLGSIAYERGQQAQAVWHCRRALEGSANDAEAFLYLGAAYMAAGQPELGLDAGQRMVACDPLASISWMILGAARWFVGRPDEAVPDLEHGLELDPQNLLVHWGAGYTYATVGRLTDAARHAAFLQENAPENPYGWQLLSLVDALEGRQEAALQRLSEIDLTPLDPHNIFHLSESFAMAGDTARALEVLEMSVDLGFFPYPFLNEYCPFMEPLRSLPGFAAVLEKARVKTEMFRTEGPLRPHSLDAPADTE